MFKKSEKELHVGPKKLFQQNLWTSKVYIFVFEIKGLQETCQNASKCFLKTIFIVQPIVHSSTSLTKKYIGDYSQGPYKRTQIALLATPTPEGGGAQQKSTILQEEFDLSLVPRHSSTATAGVSFTSSTSEIALRQIYRNARPNNNQL